jgi:DNA-3-methyladenine glycosylase II
MVNANVNTVNNILSASDASLKEVGLSRQKISYGRDLAEKINSGLLNLDELKHLSGEDAHKKLTQVKGIGDWTADIYQLFVLGDMNAFPHADLAIQEGAKRFFNLENRPSSNHLLKMAEKWVPLRGAAALVLWQIYRVEVHEGSKIS